MIVTSMKKGSLTVHNGRHKRKSRGNRWFTTMMDMRSSQGASVVRYWLRLTVIGIITVVIVDVRLIGVVKMINTKGEWIYTNAEIAYELGLSPATVNSIAKKLYGVRVPHWTIAEVKMICEYIKSITIEEDSKRLKLLHDTVCECGFEPFE